MKRIAAFAYGTVCYAVFFATFLYLVGFLGNLAVPKSIDSGTPGPWALAALVNVGLLVLFGLQHSVMARPAFKRWWTRIVPRPVERSTYVLATSLVLIGVFAAWQPMPATLWSLDGTPAAVATGIFLGGVGLVLYATFLIDHFDLFGLRQVFLYLKRHSYREKSFVTPSLYRYIRHPLYVGWFVTFWATSQMTVGHLLFAAVNTAYILVAIGFEEQDLEDVLGEEYRAWRRRTPKFVPRLGDQRSEEPTGLPATR